MRAEGVGFRYEPRGAAVLSEVTVEVGAGVTAVLGPNGAGKSTLLRVLAGLLRPTSGRASLDGACVWEMSAGERARRVAWMPQSPLISAGFTVGEVVGMGRFSAAGGAGSVGSAGAVEQALGWTGLGELRGRVAPRLSMGQQQRVSLARAVAQLGPFEEGCGAGGADVAGRGGVGTRVLLADEPFSALDPAHVARAAGVFRRLSACGVRVVAVLHDAGLAARLADRAVLLDGGGRVAECGAAAEVLTAERLGGVFGTRFTVAEVDGVASPIASLSGAGGYHRAAVVDRSSEDGGGDGAGE